MPQIANQDYYIVDISETLTEEEKALLLKKIEEGTILDVVCRFVGEGTEYRSKVTGYAYQTEDEVKKYTIFLGVDSIELF